MAKILLPQFVLPYFYESTTKEEINQKLINAALEEQTQSAQDFAMYLLRYKNTINDDIFRDNLDSWLKALKAATSRKYSEIMTTQSSRKKSLSRALTKGISLITTPNGCKELEQVYDFMALRTILHKNDIDNLYKIANLSYEYFTAIGLIAIEAKPLKDTESFAPQKYPSIQVPQCSGLKKKYQKYFKDYVLHPKNNGYQSLHINFTDPMHDYSFELQLRTFEQDNFAENLSANHKDFRKKQLSSINYKLVEVDPKKIHIDGVAITPEYIKDTTGVFEAFDMLKL